MGFDASFASFSGAMLGPSMVFNARTGEMEEVEASPEVVIKKSRHSAETRKRLEKERQGTAELLMQLKLSGLPEPRSLLHPLGQVRVVSHRRWRFDLCFEDVPLAVELQGLGTHGRVKGLVVDSEKHIAAAVVGITVLPILYKFVKDGRAAAWIAAVHLRLQTDSVKGITFENGLWIRGDS